MDSHLLGFGYDTTCVTLLELTEIAKAFAMDTTTSLAPTRIRFRVGHNIVSSADSTASSVSSS